MFNRLRPEPLPRHTISLAPQGHPLRNTLALLVLGGVLAVAWQRLSATHQSRLSNRHDTQPEPLQTWENEGGQPANSHQDLLDDGR